MWSRAAINQRQRRPQQRQQHIAAHKDHQQVADPDGNPVVDLDGVVGQHVAQHAAAVERRNGEQVEEEEREVDLDGQGAEQNQRLQAGRHALGYTARKSGEDKQAPIGNRDGDDDQNEKGGQDQQQV